MIPGREVASDPFSSASDNSQTIQSEIQSTVSAHLHKKKGCVWFKGKGICRLSPGRCNSTPSPKGYFFSFHSHQQRTHSVVIKLHHENCMKMITQLFLIRCKGTLYWKSTLPIAKLFNKTKPELNGSPLQHLLAFTLVIKSGRRPQKKIAHVRNRINNLPAWISFDNAIYYFFSQSSESLLTMLTGRNWDLQNIQDCFLIGICHLISNAIMLCWENR